VTSYPLAQMDLFGRVGTVQKAGPKAMVEEAQETTLQLKLKGVFTAEQDSESGAIVEEVGKSADYYRVGANLPGGAVLEQVFPDKILMRRNGRLESLSFEEEAGAKVAGRKNSGVKPVQPVAKVTQPKVDTPEQFVEEATRQLADDPEKALGSVGLVAGDGGYVYQGNNPMLSGLNLKQGDVIRSVNGYPLGDVKKDKALMQTLYEQGNLEVEVVRDGTSFYINYPLGKRVE
jgi:general secretion pathway protein C